MDTRVSCRSAIPARKDGLLVVCSKIERTKLLTPTPTATAPQGGGTVDPCQGIHQGGTRICCDVAGTASQVRVLYGRNLGYKYSRMFGLSTEVLTKAKLATVK